MQHDGRKSTSTNDSTTQPPFRSELIPPSSSTERWRFSDTNLDLCNGRLHNERHCLVLHFHSNGSWRAYWMLLSSTFERTHQFMHFFSAATVYRYQHSLVQKNEKIGARIYPVAVESARYHFYFQNHSLRLFGYTSIFCEQGTRRIRPSSRPTRRIRNRDRDHETRNLHTNKHTARLL